MLADGYNGRSIEKIELLFAGWLAEIIMKPEDHACGGAGEGGDDDDDGLGKWWVRGFSFCNEKAACRFHQVNLATNSFCCTLALLMTINTPPPTTGRDEIKQADVFMSMSSFLVAAVAGVPTKN